MSSAGARNGKVRLTESGPLPAPLPAPAGVAAAKPPLKDVVRIPVGLLDSARQAAFNLYSVDRFADAQVVLEGVLAVDPQDAWSLSLLGAMLRRQGKLRGALALMQAALALDSDNLNFRRMRDELAAELNQRSSSAEVKEVKR